MVDNDVMEREMTLAVFVRNSVWYESGFALFPSAHLQQNMSEECYLYKYIP